MSNTANKPLHYPKATELFHQGQQHPWVYRIQSGFVITYAIDVNGKQGLTDLYGPGSWFGPGLSTNLAVQNAKTKPDCTLQRFSSEHLWQQLANNSDLSKQLVQQLGSRDQQLRQRLFLQQTANLPARLAQLLLYLLNFQSQPCSHGHDRDVNLSQQEIAEMIGSTRQSVSQLLADWRQEGIIDYSRDYLCLENADLLRQLCD
ncbi:Crp/Fnr family transcriptional regulator [Porticoccus sp. W117]|uniref:Crp/Fnr family transcriptional regulator n=1 Tax=Porticoccus sp. W117 TaxID=3054777 RepID=UPI00259A16D9|nr:Crp/Fnr family transcriptional regulator [Porticoccus sp. W117]MDM3870380.1 Crp/Fnr family transcriptional regulator [Porticoccus sp. W117]